MLAATAAVIAVLVVKANLKNYIRKRSRKMFNLDKNVIQKMEQLVVDFVPELSIDVRYMCACTGCDGCNPCTGGA